MGNRKNAPALKGHSRKASLSSATSRLRFNVHELLRVNSLAEAVEVAGNTNRSGTRRDTSVKPDRHRSTSNLYKCKHAFVGRRINSYNTRWVNELQYLSGVRLIAVRAGRKKQGLTKTNWLQTH